MFRAVRPQADVKERTVILTDDGIATGATMIAAIHTVRAAGAKEIIVAVPVGVTARIDAIRPLCDRVICLQEPADFWAIGQFYAASSRLRMSGSLAWRSFKSIKRSSASSYFCAP